MENRKDTVINDDETSLNNLINDTNNQRIKNLSSNS